ncbi:uracil-DNA glycosylase [Litorivivens lipolytica]|uniref:Uracil-DNA glycosylase n=1 Tax=Litorivivens lipolytica TaxID=1524264 RepID=A0A7W4W299_9GAMM|nr:uracil-DNA glycosylase [Litorivivens lipolytica]
MPAQQKTIKLHPSWLNALAGEFEQDYMVALRAFLAERIASGANVFPRPAEWFNALDTTPLDQVKVVILGQDPYHGPDQAHGLCFSVKPPVPPPPSLVNIYKELNSDLGLKPPSHGCLTSWSEQGVLLLNSVLTVEQGQAGAHQGKGWERFTDAVIEAVNREREGVVFLLWGGYAQKKGQLVDPQRHCVLKAPHPSPLSAHRGFLGCRHFSKTNDYLKARGESPIRWELPVAVS